MASASFNIAKDVASSAFKSIFSSEQRAGDVESGEAQNQPLLARSKHRVAVMFHIGFKLAAFLLYLLGGLFFTSSFVTLFVAIVLMLAFDFWTVKNVTGRLLVGLRWWNEVREDGTNEWKFESLEDRSQISDIDSKVFWIALWGAAFMWSICCISSFLSFHWGWLLLCGVAVALSASNIMGYLKCSKAARNKIDTLATQVTSQVIASSLTNVLSGGNRPQ